MKRSVTAKPQPQPPPPPQPRPHRSLPSQSGLFKNASVCFQEETGIPARCSSREVPRTLKSVMPSILKTDKEAGRSNVGVKGKGKG